MVGDIRRTLAWLAALVATVASLVVLTVAAPPAQAAKTVECLSYAYACTTGGYAGVDPWGYSNSSSVGDNGTKHNCTAYAAFKVAANGASNPGNLGNAGKWDDNARAYGIAVNTSPAVGAIAQWNGTASDGSTGHVAYVEEVGADYILTTDDSWGYNYTRRVRITAGTGWPDNFIHFKDVTVTPPPPPPAWGSGGTSLIKGGGFEWGGWSKAADTNFVVYASGQIEGENARSGSKYAATNTSAAGGGIYQDRQLPIAAGDTYCASAFVRSQKGGTASGSLALWLMGGSGNESGQHAYADLGTLDNWRPLSTCVTATGAHEALRVQFYPAVGGGTTDIDDVSVNRSMAQGGGFESANGWSPMPNSNFTTYGSTARSGAKYGATNTSAAGGGFYQDRPVGISVGDTYCASAFVRSQSGGTASGTLALWLTGQSEGENGQASYTKIGSANWQPLTTCVTATRAHDNVRIQFYPTPNGGTTDVDDVNVARSLAQGGGFESGGWAIMPSSNFTTYANGQLGSAEVARSGARYGATNASAAGGGFYQDRGGLQIAAGDTFCASAFVRSQTGGKASGSFAVWLTGETDAENGVASYAQIGSTVWRPLSTCVTATRSHSNVRLQFYPTPNGGTTMVDDVSTTLNGVAQAEGQRLVATTKPAITGTARVGVKLTASTGSWRPGGSSYAYQWLRAGTAISGATASTYTPVAADYGKAISVKVTASRYGFTAGSATSAATANVAAGTITNTSPPTMTGTFKAGYTLTRGTGTWTPDGLTYSYQWRRDGVAISGATGTSYRLVTADKGHNISLAVTAKRTGYSAKTAYSAAKTIG